MPYRKDFSTAPSYPHIPGNAWERYKYNGFLFTFLSKVAEKELTMILLANSDGASRGFNLGKGNVLNSPFALLFINQFAGMKATHQ